MRVCGGIGISRHTSMGGMSRWYFTCNLKRRAVVRTESEAEAMEKLRTDQTKATR